MPILGWLVASVVMTLVGYYLLMQQRPPEPKGPELDDFKFPTADPNRPIPYVVGSIEMKGLNVLWGGDKRITKNKATRKRPTRYQFNAGVLYGICCGQIDALLGIRIKDRIAYPPMLVRDFEDDSDANADEWKERLPNISNLSAILNSPTPLSSSINNPQILTAPGRVNLNYAQFFGGQDRNGGIGGSAAIAFGGWAQTLDGFLKSRIGMSMPDELRAIDTPVPDFRGTASIGFIGDPGFWWGTNDVNFPHASVRVMRRPKADFLLNLNKTSFATAERELVMITPHADDKDWRFPAANAVAVIYELLTDKLIGAGYRPEQIDEHAFIVAARIASREKLGVSFTWMRTEKIGKMLERLCDIIAGAVFLDGKTGLISIRLLRSDAELTLSPATGDYTAERTITTNTGIVLNHGNCAVKEVKRSSYAETTSHLLAKYSDDVTGEEKGVIEINDAAFARAGGIVRDDNRSFSMIRSSVIARELAQRELRNGSRPAMGVQVSIGPMARFLRPFDVITLDLPENDDIPYGRYRVMKVPFGSSSDEDFVVELVDDVFSAEITRLSPRKQILDWSDPSTKPITVGDKPYMTSATVAAAVGADMTRTEALAIEGAIVRHFLSSDREVSMWRAYERSGADYGKAWSYIDNTEINAVSRCSLLSSKPAESVTVFSASDLKFVSNVKDDLRPGSRIVFVRHATLRADPGNYIFPRGGTEPSGEASPSYTASAAGREQDGIAAAAMMIDPAAEGGDGHVIWREEICLITAVSASGDITVRRGVDGTTPAPIVAGSTAYLIPSDDLLDARDETPANSWADGRYLPLNGVGVGTAVFTSNPYLVDDRIHRPERPANVRVSAAGKSAGVAGKVELDDPAAVSVTWSRRLRGSTLEYSHTADQSEAGVHTYVRIWRRVTVAKPNNNRAQAVIVYEARGLSGTSHTIPQATIEAIINAPEVEWNQGGIRSDLPDGMGAALVVEVGAHIGAVNSVGNAIVLVDAARQYPGYGELFGYFYGGPKPPTA